MASGRTQSIDYVCLFDPNLNRQKARVFYGGTLVVREVVDEGNNPLSQPLSDQAIGSEEEVVFVTL